MTKRTRTIAADLLPEEPGDLEPEDKEPADSSDLDFEELPCTDDADESRWEAFIPDDDEFDPDPDPGDFWVGNALALNVAATG